MKWPPAAHSLLPSPVATFPPRGLTVGKATVGRSRRSARSTEGVGKCREPRRGTRDWAPGLGERGGKRSRSSWQGGYHQLPEFTQTHVHPVGDATQPSHSLAAPSPAPNPPSIRVFSNESTLHMRWPKYWTFRFSMLNPRADLLQNGLVGSPCSPRDSQESFPTPQFKSINSALSFLHSPTLTSIHGHRKNHSLD